MKMQARIYFHYVNLILKNVVLEIVRKERIK